MFVVFVVLCLKCPQLKYIVDQFCDLIFEVLRADKENEYSDMNTKQFVCNISVFKQ